MGVSYVFVGGLHRSGTSPLHRMLASHPQVTGFSDTGVPEDEGQHLQTLLPPARAHGGPGRFGRDPASHLTEADPRSGPAAAAALLGSWGPHWDPDAPVRVEKSPPNLVRFRFLQRSFPGSLPVAVIRHPLAVALATSKWTRGTSLERLVDHWCLVHERFLADLPHLDRVLVVRYEEFIADPGRIARALATELAIEPTFDVSSIRGDGNARYERMWQERERGRMTRRGARRLVARYADRVARLGYELEAVDAHPPVGPWPPMR